MKTKTPFVSVLISVYNDEENISRAINSILNQSYKNIELLIIDDASTDNTVVEIQNTIRGKKNTIFFQNEINLGLTKNLNFLIKKFTRRVNC